MIFKTSCWVLEKKKKILKFSLLQNCHFKRLLILGQKHPKITKVVQKTVKIIKLPKYLSHFIKKNPLFNIDLFSRTFEMELPIDANCFAVIFIEYRGFINFPTRFQQIKLQNRLFHQNCRLNQVECLQGSAEIMSHCIVNKQMALASSYIFCPHPECDWSTKNPSIIWFGSTSVNIGRACVNNWYR